MVKEPNTIKFVIDPSKSFHATVGDDYRIYIPKKLREALDIHEGDTLWLIIGAIFRKEEGRLIIPGEWK